MPKVLVLCSGETDSAAVAAAIADGAGSVKFTEVEVRRIGDRAPSRMVGGDDQSVASGVVARGYRALESAESITAYDALIIVSAEGDESASAALTKILEQSRLSDRGAFVDRIGSVFIPEAGVTSRDTHEKRIVSLLIPMMHLGMIIVPPALSDRPAHAEARSHGARVAKVAEWVRHAKSHEAHGH